MGKVVGAGRKEKELQRKKKCMSEKRICVTLIPSHRSAGPIALSWHNELLDILFLLPRQLFRGPNLPVLVEEAYATLRLLLLSK